MLLLETFTQRILLRITGNFCMFPEMLIKDKKFLYNLINQLNVFSDITIKIRATEPVI